MRTLATVHAVVWLWTGAATADGEDLLAQVPLIVEEGYGEAWTATFSMPLPRAEAARLYGAGGEPAVTVNGTPASTRALGWWERRRVPRRVMVSVAGDRPVGAEPVLSVRPEGAPAQGSSPWTVEVRPFAKHHWRPYKVILRGGAHDESHSQYDDLVLGYRDRTLALRFGTRREMFHASAATKNQHDWWQWAIPEVIQDTPELKLVRVGGLLYNEDTFHQCDVFLELFGNGVMRAAAHFVNARVIGDGWEYYGIPVIGFASGAAAPAEIALDGSATRFDLGGGAALDIADSADLVSPEFPGRLYPWDGLTVYQPWKDQRISDFAKTYRKPYVTDIGEGMIPKGAARTVRFTASLSEAPPVVARLLGPSWIYALGEDLWPGGFLPAEWRFAQTVHGVADAIAQPDARVQGTYEAGFSGAASEGMGATCLLFSGMHSGDPRHIRRGVLYGYNWADLMVDHVDWSVRQPFTGYYWKTISYYKFNDLVRTYLETGDPYLIETAEHCANGYYAMFRSLWPVRSIGRGLWPVQGLLDLYAYGRNPWFLECALDLAHKARVTYQDPDNLPGHQMGVGPNGIGNINEPGDQGFAELVLADMVIQTAIQDAPETIPAEERARLLEFAELVIAVVERSLPIRNQKDTGWREYEAGVQILTALPLALERNAPDRIGRDLEQWLAPVEDWLRSEHAGRPYHAILSRARYDACTLGARWQDGELVLDPRFLPPGAAGSRARVFTPRGVVELEIPAAPGGPDPGRGE